MENQYNYKNIIEFQSILYDALVEKSKLGKAVLFVEISHKLPKDITVDEIQYAIKELVDKKYIIFEPGPGVRTRFLKGPFFSAWEKDLDGKINKVLRNNTNIVDIDKLNKMRFNFLRLLYEETKGNTFKIVDMNKIGQKLSFTQEDIESVTKYLSDDKLLEYKTLGGGISITHAGIKEIEKALGAPNEPTEHFLPIINITSIGSMNHSTLQQGTIDSSQVLKTTTVDIAQIKRLINELKKEVHSLSLSEQDKNDLELQISALENQLQSSRRNPAVVQGTIDIIKNILQGAAGSGLWQILNQIASLLI